MKKSTFKNVLCTGGTGFIGAFLIEQLLLCPDIGNIYVVSRAENEKNGLDKLCSVFIKYKIHLCDLKTRIQIVLGDISSTKLGFDAHTYDRLSKEIDVIYHLAAKVNHLASYEQLKVENVDSVSELVEFSQKEKLKVLNFASTLGAAVVKDNMGKFIEDFPCAINEYQTDMGYLRSKYEAEHILAIANRTGVQVNIFRLGYISGHSKTGVCLHENNQFMLFIKSCLQLGLAPDFMRLINLTPVDFATKIMCLPEFIEKGGAVINLINCSEYILWNDLMAWFREKGYEIEKVDFAQWQRQLLKAGRENALFRFTLLYRRKDAEDKVIKFGKDINSYNVEKVRMLTEKYNVEMPKINDKLLNVMLDYLSQEAFISSPDSGASPGINDE